MSGSDYNKVVRYGLVIIVIAGAVILGTTCKRKESSASGKAHDTGSLPDFTTIESIEKERNPAGILREYLFMVTGLHSLLKTDFFLINVILCG
jgi:hypothetical protein